MAKHVSYTQKSLKLVRDQGLLAEVVEKWVMGANIRRDLFGIIDIIAIGKGRVLGIQSTGINGRKSHIDTILDNENTARWLESGAELWQISWDKKLIKKGGSAYRYSPVIDYYALSVRGVVGYFSSISLAPLCSTPTPTSPTPTSANASSSA